MKHKKSYVKKLHNQQTPHVTIMTPKVVNYAAVAVKSPPRPAVPPKESLAVERPLRRMEWETLAVVVISVVLVGLIAIICVGGGL
jgi:hypothetical protein